MKTSLVFAVNDARADTIVDILGEIYKKYGISYEAIMKITGKTAGGSSGRATVTATTCDCCCSASAASS